MNKKKVILNGIKDGFPIGMGYIAVSFSLGILAKKAGISPIGGFFSSFFSRASAGEYGVYSLIVTDAAYIEILLISLIANLRYLLMSTALTQKFGPKTSFIKKLLTGICITDEIFGISIAYEGYLDPLYTYSAAIISGLMWATGTCLGIIAGNILPTSVVSALSVALYGMFIAIIIPQAKKDRSVLFAVTISFLLSFAFSVMPIISNLTPGNRTILLTISISAIFAYIKPIEEAEQM